MKPTLLLLALCARTLAQAHSLMQKLKKSLLMALVALPPIGFAHAAADPTLFVFTTQPDGGGWKASTYDAVTGVLLNGGFPLSSMPAALGNTLFEINGNFTIGKYNLSDGSLIKAVFITLPSNRGVAWALTAGGNNLYVTTDLGIVEQYNATTGALINADFITKVNSNDTGGIMWPAIPSTGIFSPTPNGSSGEYGPLIASGNNLYAAQAGPFWKVYNITTGALISTGLGPYWFGDAFAIIGNNAYEMFNGGGVTELNASYGNVINNSFIIPPTTTSESGIAASGNYLFVANGNAGTVAEYTADGILVNPTFITDAGDYPNTPVVALFVAPAAMSR
jgi:hypothetical protein